MIRTRLYWLLCAGALVLGAGVFSAILWTGVPTDLQAHVLIAQRAALEHRLPPNFAYYFALYAAACFSTKTSALYCGSVAVLGSAVLLKFCVSAHVAMRTVAPCSSEQGTLNQRAMPALLLIGVFLLLVVHNLPRLWLYYYAAGIPSPESLFDSSMYLGRIPPNVWHNSTTILLMPFAILLYYRSAQFLDDGERRRVPALIGLTLLNVLIKPSFFFVFAPIFPLFALIRFRLGHGFGRACLVVLAGCAAVAAEYYLIYLAGTVYDRPGEETRHGLTIAFLKVWGHYSKSLPLDIVGSLVYPLAFLCVYFRLSMQSGMYRYAWSLMLGAMVIAALFAETGRRAHAGNFLWQMYVCNNVLFLATLIRHVQIVRIKRGLDWRDWLIVGFLLLHVVAGVLYLTRLFVTHHFE